MKESTTLDLAGSYTFYYFFECAGYYYSYFLLTFDLEFLKSAFSYYYFYKNETASNLKPTAYVGFTFEAGKSQI